MAAALAKGGLVTCAPLASFLRLDGRHVVFGEVTEGFEVVKAIEATPTGPMDKPRSAVKIADCGEL